MELEAMEAKHMTSSEPKPEKNWEALEQAAQSMRELGPLARRAGAEEMRERAAKVADALESKSRKNAAAAYSRDARLQLATYAQACEELAAAIRSLPLEEPK